VARLPMYVPREEDRHIAADIVDRWLSMSFGSRWLITQGYIRSQRVNLETLISEAIAEARTEGEDNPRT
jgi:hypothetical protein